MRRAFLIVFLLAGGCSDFEQYRLVRSPVAVPTSGEGAYTLCLAEGPLKTCNPSRAIFYSYRAQDSNIWWKDSSTLIIEQTGGEVRITPPAEPISIGSHRVQVKLIHQP